MQTCEFLPPFPPFFLLKNSNFATAQKKRRGWSGHVGARALIFRFFCFLNVCMSVSVSSLSLCVAVLAGVCLWLCLWLCVCNRWRWQSNNPNGYRGNDNN